MGAPIPKRVEQKIRAASQMALGISITEVALRVGVTQRTIRRWSREPDFHRRMQEIRARVAMDVELKVLANAGAAMQYIVDGIHDENAPRSERRRCAALILDMLQHPHLSQMAADSLAKAAKEVGDE